MYLKSAFDSEYAYLYLDYGRVGTGVFSERNEDETDIEPEDPADKNSDSRGNSESSAVVIPEVLVVAIPEVLPHQEAPAPVEAVPPAQRGAVQVAFPEAVVARELLPVAEAVQAER